MKSKSKKRFIPRGYIIFWLIIIISFAITIFIQYIRYNEYCIKEAEVIKQIEEANKEALELNKDAEYYTSDEFIEKIAREKLGFIRDDEIIIYDRKK